MWGFGEGNIERNWYGMLLWLLWVSGESQFRVIIEVYNKLLFLTNHLTTKLALLTKYVYFVPKLFNFSLSWLVASPSLWVDVYSCFVYQLGILCVFVSIFFHIFRQSLFWIILFRYICHSIQNIQLRLIISFMAKGKYWGVDAAFCPCHTFSLQSPCHVSISQSPHRLVVDRESFNLTFVKLKNLQYTWFSRSTFHSSVSIHTLTLPTHTLTTVHSAQSHNSTTL
jgi:hypothetical protein